MRLLILGGIPYVNRPTSFGGTTVLMQNFLEYCASNSINYRFVSTNRFSGRLRALRNLIYTIAQILRNLYWCDCIMFNASSLKGCYLVYPIILILAKMSKSKVVFRRFAGSLKRYLEKHKLRRKFVLFCLRETDLSFFETKEQVRYFGEKGINCKWFPNVRERMLSNDSFSYEKAYGRRFVFMGHVKKTKGIREILAAFKELGDAYRIDIYGRLDDFSVEELCDNNISYKGVLNPKEVCNVLQNYDVLVLPSYMEGYPGIVIEAFSVGVPVLVTNVGGIPEIVESGKTGYVIPPQNYKALVAAILDFDKVKYSTMSKNAWELFDANFDSERVNANILKEINSLYKDGCK